MGMDSREKRNKGRQRAVINEQADKNRWYNAADHYAEAIIRTTEAGQQRYREEWAFRKMAFPTGSLSIDRAGYADPSKEVREWFQKKNVKNIF